MKPDKRFCPNCGKELEGKKTYCDDACRMAYKRKKTEQEPEQKDNPNTNKPEQMQPEHPNPNKLDEVRDSLTKTDKTFYDRAMRDFHEPYYRFGETAPTEKKCDREGCGAKFKTTLRLLRYCSYDHYSKTIGAK